MEALDEYSEVACSTDTSSGLEQALHLQQIMQGAITSRRGEATSNKIPNPANIPITWALCQRTDARECPRRPLQAPES